MYILILILTQLSINKMEKIHYISNDQLTFDRIDQIIKEGFKLALSEESKNNIIKCREYLDQKMAKNDEPIYGINTGFGSLCDKKYLVKI